MLPNQPLTAEMISKLCRSTDYIHKHDIDDRFVRISKLPVICRSIRKSNPNQIVIGRLYIIDRDSIWIDNDGDAYGTVYDLQGNRIGQMLLSHFRCI